MSLSRLFRSMICASVGLVLLLCLAGLPTIASAATFKTAARHNQPGLAAA